MSKEKIKKLHKEYIADLRSYNAMEGYTKVSKEEFFKKVGPYDFMFEYYPENDRVSYSKRVARTKRGLELGIVLDYGPDYSLPPPFAVDDYFLSNTNIK